MYTPAHPSAPEALAEQCQDPYCRVWRQSLRHSILELLVVLQPCCTHTHQPRVVVEHSPCEVIPSASSPSVDPFSSKAIEQPFPLVHGMMKLSTMWYMFTTLCFAFSCVYLCGTGPQDRQELSAACLSVPRMYVNNSTICETCITQRSGGRLSCAGPDPGRNGGGGGVHCSADAITAVHSPVRFPLFPLSEHFRQLGSSVALHEFISN